jgi:hypothetical protein
MKKIRMLTVFLFVSMMLFGVMANTASADSYGFDVGIPSAALSSYTGPYAHWEINRTDSTHADITVTALTNGSNAYLLGGSYAVALNINASSFALSALTGNNAYWGNSSNFVYILEPTGNIPSFGVFNLGMTNFDGSFWSLTSVSFTLQDLSGTWSSASNVLTNNAAGYMAVDNIYAFNGIPPYRYVQSSTVPNGYAGASGTTKVPEPTTLLLLGLGLVGVAGIRRRFKK